MKARRIRLVAACLIIAQLIVRAVVLAHSYFANDDFLYVSRAASQGFGGHYLTDLYFGQFMPGVFAVVGTLEHVSPYDWFLASLTTLVLQLWASVALFRLLRLMFGERPAVLAPFAVYLFSPLTLPMVAWWAAALQGLPLQIAIIMALTAHLRYLSDRRTRHLLETVGWLVFGLLFFVKAILIPPLLYAVTWLLGPPRGFAEAGRRYLRSWAAQLATLGVFAVVYLSRIGTSFVRPRTPGPGEIGRLAAGLLGRTFVTEAMGGPLNWLMLGPNDALSAPTWPVTVVCWVALVAVVAASILLRRDAVRAWALLAGYLLADVVVVLAGRLGPVDVATRVSRYVADSAPILAIVLAAAFLPLTAGLAGSRAPSSTDEPPPADLRRLDPGSHPQDPDPGRLDPDAADAGAGTPRPLDTDSGRLAPHPLPHPAGIGVSAAPSAGGPGFVRWGAAGVGLLVSVGCVVSTVGLVSDLRVAPVRSYLGTVRQGLRIAPDTQDIYPSLVPDAVAGALFGDDRLTSRVLSPLARPALADRMRNPQPTSTPWVFDDRGFLRRLGIYGAISGPGPGRQCFPADAGTITIPITVRADPTGVGSLAYLTPGEAHVRAAGVDMLLPRGIGQMYFPLHDAGTAIHVVVVSGGTGLCFTGAAAGAPVPSTS